MEPSVRMNPILLKPTSDTGEPGDRQRRARGVHGAAGLLRHKARLIPEVMAAYRVPGGGARHHRHRGAGSPAEINLRKDDIVNMGMAKRANAPVLLAATSTGAGSSPPSTAR